jgi:hypothetical protein
VWKRRVEGEGEVYRLNAMTSDKTAQWARGERVGKGWIKKEEAGEGNSE